MHFLTPDHADDICFIRQILASSGYTKINHITRLQSGSRSVAYWADDYIIRFPKAEVIWQTMKREKGIIDAIYPHLMPSFEGKIQKIKLIEGEYPFSVSKRLYGKICDGRQTSNYAVLYQSLSSVQQAKLAKDIAMFFHLMHQIDYEKLKILEPTEAIDDWDVTTRDSFDYASVREALLSYAIDLDDYQPTAVNNDKALCHNDLSGSNLLLNPKNDNILAGIIDFGNVIVMPKYQDFFPLYKINRKLAMDTLTEYNKLTTSKIEQKQIDFMALCYIGYGLAQNNDKALPYFMKLLKAF